LRHRQPPARGHVDGSRRRPLLHFNLSVEYLDATLHAVASPCHRDGVARPLCAHGDVTDAESRSGVSRDESPAGVEVEETGLPGTAGHDRGAELSLERDLRGIAALENDDGPAASRAQLVADIQSRGHSHRIGACGPEHGQLHIGAGRDRGTIRPHDAKDISLGG
jgi:hypothetical protein